MVEFSYSITFNKLRNCLQRKERFSSHLNFLETCKKEDTIPKGFQLKWRNTNDRTEEDIVSTQNILTRTSKTLMCQTIDKLKNTLTNIEIDINLGYIRL